MSSNKANLRHKPTNALPKTFSTSETLSYIFKKPWLFQQLIELSDQEGDLSRQIGFSEVKYSLLMNSYLNTEVADDRARYRIICSPENLKQANILIDWDKGKKRLTFADDFIGLIRLSDERLIRELTSVEYEGMLEELRRLRDKLSQTGLKSIDQEKYFDIRHAIFNHLRKIRSAIRCNEIKFRTLSRALAELTRNATTDDLVYAQKKREMYSQASKIYDRHIKPTVEFLDESLKVDRGNLFITLRDVATIFKQRLEHDFVEELTFAMLNLSNSYKPIEATAIEVRKFLTITRSNARSFSAIDLISKEIDLGYESIRNGSMKNKNLGNNQDLIEMFDFFRGTEGVKNIRPKNTLLFSTSQSFFNTMNLEVEQLLAAKGIVDSIELEESCITLSGKAIKKPISDKDRATKIVQSIKNIDLRETEDLYHLLNDRLSILVPNYSFFDLHQFTRGLTDRIKESNLVLIPTGFTNDLIINNVDYVYNIRKLKKAKTDA